MEKFVLIEYLEGALDEGACKEVEEWIASSEENQEIVENLYVLLFVSDRIKAMHEIDTRQAFKEFTHRKSISENQHKRLKPALLWQRIAGAVAVFAVFLVSATFITFFLLDKYSEPLVVSTRLGEKAHVTLPDGSNVWLNTCSHLEYKKIFLSPKRRVNLKGEAYFEVNHNRLFPFIVADNNSEIKVLGTKFNVQCNEDENFLSAALIEGSILFSDITKKLSRKLLPGENLLFDKINNTINLTRIISPEDVLGWVEGKLIFHNASLEEIARSLEKHYNVKILFKDENVKTERFNAEFEVTDNIYHILSMLELTNKFIYETDKREIIISSK
jgi:ferric-dicitrate binding protein FerR (iron transport regulator)